ncbi:Sterile alpha motif, type 1 [Plasmopara halstedii]|uniref:Sterile alpha motif, type 1 n=1 Tax=Plasmopara halstedii TaxID=4781 RepID=A0A0P1A5X0_PLAHL|nr:Sterile alpha motif, type 1 [Plasmopara halstedii]CEG35530.1 Sterile alpha motif, type 1 [Plasmopara halstedii]|eukprot:XP_024571899.1 Sterile alpha motif, type 1 [Plasmopara halstedii]
MTKEGVGGVFGKKTRLQKSNSIVSERLEVDARAMEERLMQLRVALQEEKKKRIAAFPLQHTGSRWRSAREDRGSVRQYARDVELKTFKKKEGARIGTKKKNKSLAYKRHLITSPSSFEDWTVPQVLEWLKSIGLEELQSGFEYHQVTGRILLDFSPKEYEKLGVFSVSARNRLVTEMDHIRAQQVSKRMKDKEDSEIVDSINSAVPKARDVSGKLTHWSQIAPLADNVVTGEDIQAPVNLADGDFQEEASHASFLEALLEWRENDTKQLATSNQEELDEWINPMFNCKTKGTCGGALLEGSYDEADAHDTFQEALQAWRSRNDAKVISVEKIESSCTPGDQQCCWQCYRILQIEQLLHDDLTNKSFCSSTCQENYNAQYGRLYTKSV